MLRHACVKAKKMPQPQFESISAAMRGGGDQAWMQ
jgi:hypothetical protein